jgi:hypothetical protein
MSAPNNRLQRTGIRKPLIDNLPTSAVVSRAAEARR